MKKILIFLSMLLISCLIYWFQSRNIYYEKYNKKYNEVRDELSKINGVKILHLEIGNYDSNLKEVNALIKYDDKIVIRFSSSTYPSSPYPRNAFAINEFGDWKFQIYECNHFYNESGYADSYSMLSQDNHLYYKVNDIKTAVLYYQEIEKIVDTIPEYPKFTQYQTDKDISTIYICKYKKNLIKAPIFSEMACDSLDKLLKSQ